MLVQYYFNLEEKLKDFDSLFKGQAPTPGGPTPGGPPPGGPSSKKDIEDKASFIRATLWGINSKYSLKLSYKEH